MPTPFTTTLPSFPHTLDGLRAQLEALPADQLEEIRVDIERAASVVLGSCSTIEKYRAPAAEQLGEATAAFFDALRPSTIACMHAHVLYLTALRGGPVEELATELAQVRRVLRLEAEGLVEDGHVTASSLAELVGGTGYRVMSVDVLQLVAVFRASWVTLEAHTTVTSDELDRAESLAGALLTALGEQEKASTPQAELRQRAYTHFFRTYDEVRRALTFLCWRSGNVDAIAPSLFGDRERSRPDANDETPDASDAPPTPSPVTTVTTTSVAPASSVTPASPDQPGAPPFVAS